MNPTATDDVGSNTSNASIAAVPEATDRPANNVVAP